ncbi:hypothetical protein Dthio_PD2137 [Desulfonatronospira thiodismutans ASO3-1]|uniref:CRISPR type III-associated protein domain-containing protein n=1 Tax=Desulfonatronospira thiodismutans ASO3-1 TaxID=555779 RepID=D6SPT5_9BACT|nr:RAMP superfamily CRISPR-associated protein [Desulfonatronospira thiodismutans]EFI34761.1 hypothetical protein Dthio_PD2137 [Desulfonatronospira thiodismutans ASO3-1]
MNTYWIIDYRIRLLSDFHAGAGITLVTGNTHGLRLDEESQPYLPATQVRGLLRQAGHNIKRSIPELQGLFKQNFPDGSADIAAEKNYAAVNSPRGWSFTRAMVKDAESREDGLQPWSRQAHVHIDPVSGVVLNLFGYEKAGAKKPGESMELVGRIYSNTPAEEKDAALMLACMRFEDRIGHRRSRGYGKVDWVWDSVRSFTPGSSLEAKTPKDIFEKLF